MKRLYAPWRSSYTKDTAHTKSEDATERECIFCEQFAQQQDEKHFIFRRFEYNVLMLNRFPYNAGHLLIMPIEHKAKLEDLPRSARLELIELAMHGDIILRKAIDAHGTNIGINLGKAAGAGIPSHLHMHVLPRFFGDTNFLPALAETKQISLDLHDIFSKLKPLIDAIDIHEQ